MIRKNAERGKYFFLSQNFLRYCYRYLLIYFFTIIIIIIKLKKKTHFVLRILKIQYKLYEISGDEDKLGNILQFQALDYSNKKKKTYLNVFQFLKKY